jgi:hypothetical protein
MAEKILKDAKIGSEMSTPLLKLLVYEALSY